MLVLGYPSCLPKRRNALAVGKRRGANERARELILRDKPVILRLSESARGAKVIIFDETKPLCNCY
jgi:hypothetical protein